ncbi:hypothetical protein [Caulobacter sp. NIBR2454]|uniref:hypothetical protein n=1 Tax=Caulobacter sp. NIBR2454 TaxID=3015996 RepID=UPI0022B6F93F|nr:hypothetical protein [Caulobacter sp. NIBR2454]
MNRIVGGIQYYGGFREIRPIEPVRAPRPEARTMAVMQSVNGGATASSTPAVQFGGALSGAQMPKAAQAPAQTAPGSLVNVRI